MTSEMSGIPLVGFLRTLRHILEPEIGETRLWTGRGVVVPRNGGSVVGRGPRVRRNAGPLVTKDSRN